MLCPDICEIADLMPATCPRGDDLYLAALVLELVDQILGDLDRQVIFLSERSERACHSTACGIEYRRFSPGQTFAESSHEFGIHDRFSVTMRMNCDRRVPVTP